MKPKAKKALIASGIAVCAAGLGALYAKSAQFFMKLAMDRDAPKSVEKGRKKVAGSWEGSGAWSAVVEASKSLKNSGCEEVSITASHDGIRLVGHWHTCEHPKRIIVAMHGWRASWLQDFGLIAPFWFQNDCAVLFAEQRAQGNSEGDYMGFGLLERFDCLDWINWANERTEGKLPIYLGGVSMGATTVLMTAGFELPANVRGIAADCGFTSPHAIWESVAESSFHVPYGIYQQAAENLCRRKILVSGDSYSTLDAMEDAKIPILFIHGTDDHFVPVEMTYENYRACKSEKELFVVPGAEHGMSYLVDKAGYEQRVLNFWKKYDALPTARNGEHQG